MNYRAYEIARNCKYGGYQRALENMVYKFFDKKKWSGVSFSEKLAEKLDKPVNEKFKRRKVYMRFKDNICASDVAEMGLFFSKNKNVKNVKFIMCDRCFH